MKILKLRDENYPNSQSSEAAKLALRCMLFYVDKIDLYNNKLNGGSG